MTSGKTKKREAAAYHEAGHAIAHLINNVPFEYLTIRPEGTSLGHLSRSTDSRELSPEISSFLDPDDFYSGFKGAFVLVSGYISEKLYTRKDNIWGASQDLKELWEGWFSDLSEPLVQKSFDFMCEYTKEVLSLDIHQVRIKAIAAALLKHETLSYEQVNTIASEAYLQHMDGRLRSPAGSFNK